MTQEPLRPNELLQLKWLGGVLTYLVALWAVAALESVGIVLIGLCAATAVVFAVRPRRSELMPTYAWNVAATALVLFVLVSFVLSGADIITPLLRMLMLLGLLRAAQPRLRRADLQLVLLSLFMLVLSGVLTMSLRFAFQLFIYTPVAMTTLLVITLAESIERKGVPQPLWADFSWRTITGRVRQAMRWRAVGMYVGLYASLLAATALIFFTLPRFRLDQALPFMRLPAQKSLSGFSDSISFGDVTDITKSDAVALRVDLPEGEQPVTRPYWRMAVLDEYTGGGFRVSRSARVATRHLSESTLLLSSRRDANAGDWTFYMEGGISRYLPLPGQAASLRFQDRRELEVNENTRVVMLRDIPGSVVFYQADALRPGDTVPSLFVERRALQNVRPGVVETHGTDYPYTTLYLPLQPSDQQYLREAVEEIDSSGRMDPATFALAAALWLEDQHAYSLNSVVPSGPGDTLVRWMRSDEPGHCELFAGSQVLLLRAAGHPARVVTGFVGGGWNGYENFFVVRNSDAHAWVEVFDGRDWQRTDPTPGGSAAGTLAQWDPDVDRTFSAYLDSLRVLWYRRIVNFDQEQQQEMLGWVREFTYELRDWLEEWARSAYLDLRELAASPWRARHWLGPLRHLAVALVLWLALRLLVRLWLRGRHGAKRARMDPIRARAGRLLARADSSGLLDDTTRDALLVIRYGPRELWPQRPRAVFRAARSAPPRQPHLAR